MRTTCECMFKLHLDKRVCIGRDGGEKVVGG